MKYILTFGTVLSSLLIASQPATAQLLPQFWGSLGAREGDVTYAIGARALNLGVELGRGTEDSAGVDALAFVNIPLTPISPYVGIGLYSEDQGVALSGGVHVNAAQNLILGAGYHSVRGVNGRVGIRF